MRASVLPWVAASALLLACGSDSGPSSSDTGEIADVISVDVTAPDVVGGDVAGPDAGTPDVGTPDTGTPDTGTPDVGTPDTGTPDVGTPDTGTPDVGTPDTGTPDVGTPDTGTPDVGTPDTGTPDVGTPDTGPDVSADIPPDVPPVCDPVDCDDQDPCTDDVCVAGTCEHTDNTAVCDDLDPCTENDVCAAGQCAGTEKDCDDQDVCTDDSCDATGTCQHADNTVGCDDSDPCTENDVCAAGQCAGTDKDCDDQDVCTDDSCDATGTCQHADNTAGCDDSDPCTENDVCAAGQCAGTDKDCDDQDVCTDDSCDAMGTCQYVNNAAGCDDEDLCTEDDVCSAGVCAGADKDCGDDNDCTTDSCAAGECSNVDASADCDDDNPCTINGCEPQGGCTTETLAEGTACGQVDGCGVAYCESGQCQTSGNVDGAETILRFEDGSGTTAADESGANNPGNLVGSASWAGGAVSLPGNDGTSAVRVPDLEGGTFTVSARIFPTATGSRWIFSRNAASSTNGFGLGMEKGVYIQGASYNSQALHFPIQQWTHVAATYDGAVLKLFRNGVVESEIAHAGGPVVWNGDLWVGQELDSVEGGTNADQAFAGSVDDLVWLPYAATPEHVLALSEGGGPGCDDGDACTTDVCLGGTVCASTPREGACDDGDDCTVDVCVNGACRSSVDGAVFKYDFTDVEGGVVLDVSGLDNHTTLNGDATVSSSALELPATSDVDGLRVPGSIIPKSTFTFAARVYPDVSDNRCIVSRPSTAASNGFMWFSEGDVRINNVLLTSNAGVTTGAWTSIAATYDGQVLRVFRGGVAVATAAVEGGLTWNGDLWIGQDVDCADGCTNVDQAFDGAMDAIHWFDRALTPEEIQQLAWNESVACSDGNRCTVNQCSAGSCTEQIWAIECDDGNPCTVDSCDPIEGCLHELTEIPCGTEDEGADALYMGIWHPGADRVLVKDLTFNELGDTTDTQSAAGRRLIDIEVRPVGSSVRYDAVYAPKEGKGWAWYVYATAADFEAKRAELDGNNTLIDFEHLTHPDGYERYIGVWHSDDANAEVVYDLSYSDFGDEWDTRRNAGWLLVDVEVSENAAGSNRWYGVFRQTTGAYAMWRGATWGSISAKMLEWHGTYQLVDIEQYGDPENPRYVAVWLGSYTGAHIVGPQTLAQFDASNAANAGLGYALGHFGRLPAGIPRPPVPWAGSVHASAASRTVGYSLAVSKDGQTLGMHGSGESRADWEAEDPDLKMTAYTRTQLASVSKPISATAFMTLVESQEIDLDEPFYPYVEYLMPVAGTGVEDVTFRDILQHRSGFDMLGKDGSTCRPDLVPMLQGMVASDLVASPGTYDYGNPHFCLIRLLIEVFTGIDYADYVNDTLMIPVGTLDMTMNVDEEQQPTLYYKLDDSDEVVEEAGALFSTDYTEDGGAYGWYASVADLIRWLNGVRSNAYLPAALRDEMHSSGLGWFGRNTTEGTAYVHNGSWRTGNDRGVRTVVGHFPDGYSAVLLVNTWPQDIEAYIIDAFEAQATWPAP